MIEDNWSLRHLLMKSWITYEYQDSDHTHKLTDEDEVYRKSDIDTLRQKLIDDFTKYFDNETGCDTKEEVTKLINQRFGVEDDK